jgi:hypothetical protein
MLHRLHHELNLAMYCLLDKPWQKEIELMLKNGVKLEVEALISKDISYITEEYVPPDWRRASSWTSQGYGLEVRVDLGPGPTLPEFRTSRADRPAAALEFGGRHKVARRTNL